MASLPTLSGREVVRAFSRNGWELARQRGSHMILVKAGHMATLSVPDHKEIAKGTLRSLIRSSGLTVDEFVGLAGKQTSPPPHRSPDPTLSLSVTQNLAHQQGAAHADWHPAEAADRSLIRQSP